MQSPFRPLALVAVAVLLSACQTNTKGNNIADMSEDVEEKASNQFNSVNDSPTFSDDFQPDGSEPIARKSPFELTHHGYTRVDNYYWMRDDERKNQEVLRHLARENAHADAQLAHTQRLQDELFEEINGRMKKDDSSVPYQYKNYFYYSRYQGDKEYPVIARKKSLSSGVEEVLLDGNVLAEGEPYFSIGDYGVSTNEKILAYSSDTVGRRLYDIRFKDLTTGELLEDKLEQTTGQVVWANDNKTVFYISRDPQTLLGYLVYRHEIGTSQARDVLVYEESDNSFFTWLDKTKDDTTIAIYHDSTTTQGVSILNANEPKGEFALFAPLETNQDYAIAKLGDWFYIRTNWNATNFRIMKVQAANASDRNKWQEVVAHNERVLLQDFDIFEKHLTIDEKERGQSRIRILNLNDKRSHVIAFDDPAYMVAIGLNTQIDTDKLRIEYSSLTTPETIYDYNMATREKTVLKRDEVIGDFDPFNYKSERVFVSSRDGKSIPVSLVYRKELFTKDGSNPIYVYGYGSYGYNIEPEFSGSRLSLLDRGFVFAIAHVRGSQTLGRSWYEDGKMFNKINTFNDFIDVSTSLVEQGYADKEKVFAAGGSAGGLLMGAIINMAPDIYKGVAAHVPFVDVVTTMLDASIPLTTNEYDEWGNPELSKASYDYMRSYSPYDNVVARDYPNLLVTTGLHDSQVQYFEPAKWVAKLREKRTNDNALLFKINMEAGHGGASGRFKRNKLRALEYAFFMDLAGIEAKPEPVPEAAAAEGK